MLFGFGKKKETEDVRINSAKTTGIPLQQKIEKHTESLGIVLKQKNLAVKTARVVLAMDVSGSMSEEFRNGTVQDITERIMPLGLEFDDNGELEFYIFSNDYKEIESVNIRNLEGFVKKKVEPKAMWRGTSYSPIIEAITERYGKKDPSKDPTFVVFITDGDNSDKPETIKAMQKASEYNIFWKFVGIGSASMPFLEKLDDMEGRVVDNANFFQVSNINRMNDKTLYENLLEEYGDWIGKASMLGIL